MRAALFVVLGCCSVAGLAFACGEYDVEPQGPTDAGTDAEGADVIGVPPDGSSEDGGDKRTTVKRSVALEHAAICFRTEAGLKCRGENDQFRLGIDGDGGVVPTPIPQSPPLPGVPDNVVFGSFGGAAIVAGEAYFWGEPAITFSTVPSPTKTKFGKSDVLDVAVGLGRACVLSRSGADCWGNPALPTGFIAGARAAAVGDGHSCVIARVGGVDEVQCWGDNSYHAAGTAPTPADCPDVVTWCKAHTISLNGEHPVVLSAAARHTCAGTAEGNVYCWGWSVYGQTGAEMNGPCATAVPDAGITGCQATPQKVPLPRAGVPIALVEGWQHSCVLLGATPTHNEKNVYCWGSANTGALSKGGNEVPRGAAAEFRRGGVLMAVDEVAAGGFSTCVVAAGKVYCVGSFRGGDPAIDEPTLVGP